MEFILLNQPRVFPRQPVYKNIKRLFDVVLCLSILPIVLPMMMVCAMAIALDTPGPIFFIQKRIGKGGRIFRMFKFRTMVNNPDDSQSRAFMKAYVRGEIKPDGNGKKTFKPISQVTRVGRILRRTSFDELPQIINVIKGEMSIVGPRPNIPCEVDEYRPWHYERLEVLPGITGLAQVRGRSCIDFNSIARNDIEYIENQSLGMDLCIYWWSFTTVLLGKGAE